MLSVWLTRIIDLGCGTETKTMEWMREIGGDDIEMSGVKERGNVSLRVIEFMFLSMCVFVCVCVCLSLCVSISVIVHMFVL